MIATGVGDNIKKLRIEEERIQTCIDRLCSASQDLVVTHSDIESNLISKLLCKEETSIGINYKFIHSLKEFYEEKQPTPSEEDPSDQIFDASIFSNLLRLSPSVRRSLEKESKRLISSISHVKTQISRKALDIHGIKTRIKELKRMHKTLVSSPSVGIPSLDDVFSENESLGASFSSYIPSFISQLQQTVQQQIYSQILRSSTQLSLMRQEESLKMIKASLSHSINQQTRILSCVSVCEEHKQRIRKSVGTINTIVKDLTSLRDFSNERQSSCICLAGEKERLPSCQDLNIAIEKQRLTLLQRSKKGSPEYQSFVSSLYSAISSLNRCSDFIDKSGILSIDSISKELTQTNSEQKQTRDSILPTLVALKTSSTDSSMAQKLRFSLALKIDELHSKHSSIFHESRTSRDS
ncbi:hypothetical protein ADUPG1_011113, partial [Aduncisulcus paluster]